MFANYKPETFSTAAVSDTSSRVTLPENFAYKYKPGLSFNPLARVTLAVGLPLGGT